MFMDLAVNLLLFQPVKRTDGCMIVDPTVLQADDRAE